jgi:hypothetical protein
MKERHTEDGIDDLPTFFKRSKLDPGLRIYWYSRLNPNRGKFEQTIQKLERELESVDMS